MFGASVYFPPLFKAVLLGFFIWLFLHRQLRDWMYAGDIWHPLLMDLSLFALAVCLAPGIAHCLGDLPCYEKIKISVNAAGRGRRPDCRMVVMEFLHSVTLGPATAKCAPSRLGSPSGLRQYSAVERNR